MVNAGDNIERIIFALQIEWSLMYLLLSLESILTYCRITYQIKGKTKYASL